ncbi:MAG: magnesium/cobalt transporter CorA [Thermovirgaceae bacterium]
MISPKRFLKRRAPAPGLPPGTLVHVGERKTEEARITLIDYAEGRFSSEQAANAEACRERLPEEGVLWINVDGIHDLELLESFGKHFGIHRLVLEDICNTDQRPKMEDHGEYLYIVLKMADYDEATKSVDMEQVSLILMKGCVITFQEKPGDVFDPVRDRLRTGRGKIRSKGADYLAYALLDAVVDRYFLLLEKLGDDVEALDEQILTDPGEEAVRNLHALKREMIFLRKAAWPMREIVGRLERGGSVLVTADTAFYLRDLYDHAVQVMDSIETFRDVLSGLLDIYLSSAGNRMNEIMKVLTIIATIFIPLTFIAGIYGMNFEHMPELALPWAYPAIWAVMLTLAGGMLVFFRKKKWI